MMTTSNQLISLFNSQHIKEATIKPGAPARQQNAMNQFLAGVERKAFRMADIATQNREDALEIVQEAMIGFQRYRDNPPEEWKPLFYRILSNRINDWHRRSSVRNRVMVVFNWVKGQEHSDDPVEQAPAPQHCQPANLLQQQHATEAIVDAIKQLPPRQQQALMLRAWEGFSIAETAEIMKCSEGSVKTHYSRAAHTMRGLLEGYQP